VFTQGQWTRSFANSLKVALGATVLGVAVGGLAATGVMLANRFLRVVLTGLFVSPLVIPSIVVGVAFAYSFGRLGLSGSYWGLVIAHAILGAPLAFLSVMTSLRGLDPNLDLAAASLGGSRLHRFWHVTLPMTMPGFLAAALFTFITSFDEVVVALFLAAPDSTTLPITLFSGLRDRLQPTIVVVALLLSLFSLALFYLMNWLRKRGRPQEQ
jgi:putative spermidine/putrescine transport system permease protein